MSYTAPLRRSRMRPGFIAAMAHRVSGLALAIFLPLHFLALGAAVSGADRLESFLTLTENPVIKFLEWGLVLALSVHLTCGLRVLALEFLPARENTVATVSICFGGAFAAGLLFLMSVNL